MDREKLDKTTEVTAEPIKDTISYAVFEGVQARNERNIKRLVILIIVLIALLFASNMAWLLAYTQYDYSDYELSSDGYSNANFIGGAVKGDIKVEGDINNGGKDKSENPNEEERLTGDENPSEGEN